MAKAKIKDIKKQIQQQDKNVYGDTSISGSAPDPESDDDVEEVVKEITGEKPEQGQQFNISKEVEKDEKARRTKPEIEKEE
jgi:hypothetical protein